MTIKILDQLLDKIGQIFENKTLVKKAETLAGQVVPFVAQQSEGKGKGRSWAS